MKLRSIVVGAMLATLSWPLVVKGQATSMEKALEQRAVRFDVRGGSLNLALQRLAREFDLAIGYEALPDSKGLAEINVNIEDGTLRDVLNALITNDPRYTCTTLEQTINVYPVIEEDPLMQLVIPHFRIERVDLYGALNILFNSPGIHAELERVKTKRRDFFDGNSTQLRSFSIDMKQVTVRQTLNAIAHCSNSGFWTFSKYGKQNEYFSIWMSRRPATKRQ
jgi:hypothetical protein